MESSIIVSVGVVSYNSAETIIETLNSIFDQSYPFLELIIADDGSNDFTIEVCERWLEVHSSRFIRAIILSSKTNEGIPANCNKVINSASGQWVKMIAADDILFPSCISECISFIQQHKDAHWIVGKTKRYIDNFNDENVLESVNIYTKSRLNILIGSLKEQQEAILKYNFIEAPATFMKTDLIRKIGGFDEDYRLIEDWPIYKKILDAGFKCYFLDKEIVGYRQSEASVFNIKSKLFNFRYIDSVFKFKSNVLFPYHDFRYRFKEIWYYKLCLFLENHNLNNNSKISRSIYSISNRILNLL